MCQNATFFEYLDTPQFLTLAMYSITVIATPIHLFGTICIILKTPIQMKSMKMAMLNLHLWSISLDFSFSFLIIPFIYQPVLAGYSLGLLGKWGVPVKDLYYLSVVQIAGVTTSVALLFETRFFILYARETKWKSIRRFWILANYTVSLIYMLPTYFSIPDQKSGKLYQFGRYPCLPIEVYNEQVFLLSTWSTGVALNMSLNTAGQQTLIFVFLIFWNMKKSMNRVKMSKKTMEMQRILMRTLVLQVTIPLATVIGPLVINIFTVYNSYYNQGANNISMIIMATHGLVSSLAMIYLHKSYWATFLQLVCPCSIEENKIFTLVHVPPDFS